MASFQDMPPPGGFSSIPVERTFAKPLIRQGVLLFTTLALTIYGFGVIREWRLRYRTLKIEQMEHFIAAQPFIVAEQERKYLRTLRLLREEERELMKDHKGWIVGTLYGERPYKTLPAGALPYTPAVEYSAHMSQAEYERRFQLMDSHQ